MQYPNVHLAKFIDRPNRFIAHCQLIDTGEVVTTHVKNTGRTTILQPGVTTALVHNDNPNRKTRYDLVAAKKYDRQWINIDSQAPNKVVKTGLETNYIKLPGIQSISKVNPETTYLDSRLDFAGADNLDRPFFLEVKGVTLINEGIAAFPDAPTTRGLKHVQTLERAVDAGYLAYLLFVIQISNVKKVTIDRDIFNELAVEIGKAQRKSVHVVAYDCKVEPDTLVLDQPVPFDLNQKFVSDGLPSSIGKQSK
ncbi:DNA/RNA nuclease SfsA [Lentilactobacillus kefiri]|uniref:Sugar fermentation stimulation protein homolog n=2 Tax=Lentilactobacillus kefiri TaxID=33962 RepID=A0A8E1V1F2_LENKE|nr:DNA/RNA nuclease SfsA [Lentilactobacillus kefiri]KRL73647.1 sugar fermentation stimulation protein A [Lentilactobacillus parakefiri DSM 10551]KRM49750.1 sugar fermentation stimulation protein A [Lentilactobacillus kefiri DSM 20587 = JCM 5818]MCJ2161608.1 DNA/RNA nuclease SfsA [Lentilactobacillus kefiri]MCP9368197.1 DNA/RNA nuclease SfsA [Lentilactobacillus kefiri]MDH5108263.1 DNA/RNA nuclease SfsA [Lentilactobacillus kefiri]